MKSKLTHLFAGIFILLAFVQCEDSIPLTGTIEEPTQQNLTQQPQLLTPENGSSKSTSLSLTWSEVENADSYQIQLSTTKNFASPVVDGTADSTSFAVAALPGDTTIFWKVRPLLQDTKGPWSEVGMFKTIAADSSAPVTTSPQSPEKGATEVPTDVKLQWATVATASAYNVQIATDKNFSSVVAEKTVEAASFQSSKLSTQTTYYWRVEPMVENKETKWSEPFSFTTGVQTAETVVLVSPENQATNQATTLTLKWEETSEVDVYQVQVATESSFSSPIVNETTSEASYEVSDLKSSQTYFWRVQVAADESTENWSKVREFKTEAGTSTTPPSTTPSGIVSVSNGNFVVNGEVFRFAGTNAYYLHSYEKIDPQFVTNTFEAFEEAGITVVRMWAFYDGYDCGWSAQDPTENVIQTAPGEYSEEALKDLDSVIAKAKEHGIRLILTLANYWDELGGICAYNTWDGAANPSTNMKHFINDPDTQRWFKQYIKMLTNRVNTVTGVAYKNSPAIFSWEIMNEAKLEAQGADPTVLRNWYQEMAQFIKSQDPNHMVSTGSEGQEVGMIGADSPYSVDSYSNTYVLRSGGGTSYKVNTAIPEIDYGTAHWYPNGWGFGQTASESLLQAQRAWITDHARIAEEMGKPFVLGEYGFDNGWSGNDKMIAYKNLWSLAEKIELDGSLIWQYTTNYYKCSEYGGNICWPGGGDPDPELYNAFKAHIQIMNNSK